MANKHFLLIFTGPWISVRPRTRDTGLLKTDLSLKLMHEWKKKKSFYILLFNLFENPRNHPDLWSDYENDLVTALMAGDPEASRDQTGSGTIECIYVK